MLYSKSNKICWRLKILRLRVDAEIPTEAPSAVVAGNKKITFLPR